MSALVIGIGNELRGDDAAGLLVVQRIREQVPQATVMESSADPMTLMEAWEGESLVLLVDAVESGGAAGTIHRHDAHAEALPADFFHCSTHSIGVAEAVEFARNLQRLPERVIVFGVEGNNFQPGAPVSEAVLQAVGEVAKSIEQEFL